MQDNYYISYSVNKKGWNIKKFSFINEALKYDIWENNCFSDKCNINGKIYKVLLAKENKQKIPPPIPDNIIFKD